MEQATFTFRVDGPLKDAFASVAKAHDRSGAQLLRDFMRDYVSTESEASDYDAWFRNEVKAGLDAANSGDVITASEVEADAQAWQLKMISQLSNKDVQ